MLLLLQHLFEGLQLMDLLVAVSKHSAPSRELKFNPNKSDITTFARYCVYPKKVISVLIKGSITTASCKS